MKKVLLSALFTFFSLAVFSQSIISDNQQTDALRQLSKQFDNENKINQQKTLVLGKQAGWDRVRKSSYGSRISLKGVDTMGFPIYIRSWNNILSAATTQTNAIQPGGKLNLNLSGSSPFMQGKLAIWDEGIINWQHQEFSGKNIIRGDGASNIEDHSTHVAGTMIAKGINPLAKGMAFDAADLLSYDYNNDEAEMADAAPHLLISNHSYGYQAGWSFDNSQSKWQWEGLPGDTVDYKFGFYGTDARNFDQIAFNAPYYLIVQSAGNSRSETGPPVGSDYYGYKSRTDPTFINRGPRPPNISDNNSYDVITGTSNAKNNLTVGAVYPIPNGPVLSGDVKIAPFSSWGPTDDGRIKPDICGNGVSVLSTGGSSPNSYFTSSGTSMSTANVSGSLFLLQEYFAQRNQGKFMRSATLKALVCHTSFDAGNPGPDYVYGWGLLNAAKAAQAISDQGIYSLISEQTLKEAETQTFQVTPSSGEPLVATIAWTDPASNPTGYGIINDRLPKLINDLDLRVTDGNGSYLPWVLDPEHPSLNATAGDNTRDNIEQVVISNPIAGKAYMVCISHKKRLTYGLQNYSLIVTGIQNARLLDNVSKDISLAVFPVPARSELTVALNASSSTNLVVVLINALGQRVYENAKAIPIGAYVTQINTSKFASGIYELEIRYGKTSYFRKIIVTN